MTTAQVPFLFTSGILPITSPFKTEVVDSVLESELVFIFVLISMGHLPVEEV